MATIKSTITMYDNMTASLKKINNMVQSTTNTMGKLQGSMKDMSTPNIKAPEIDTSKATQKVSNLQESLSKQVKAPNIDSTSATKKIDNVTKKLNQGIKSPETTIKVNSETATKKIKLIENALTEAQKKFDKTQLDPKVSADSILSASNKVSRLEKQLESAKSSMKGMDVPNSSGGNSTPPTGNSKSSLSSIQSTASSVGSTLTKLGAAATVSGMAGIKSYGTFAKTMNQAAVVAGGSAKDIKGLTHVAEDMGNELPLSAKESAEAMLSMARDGADLSHIKSEFPAVARASTAAGADLQATASVVQQSMNIWGKSIGTPAQAAATLTQTANLSNASIEDMQQALATIGGTASNAGISMQDTSTAIGLLTNKGFSAAQASQDLNHAVLMMQAPSKGAAKQMAALGLSFNDAQGNMKQFPQILSEIAQKMDGMSSSDKAAALKQMFGTSGMSAILPLMESIQDKTGSTTTSWSAFSKELKDTTTTASDANKFLSSQAAEMQKNVGSKLKRLQDNMGSLNNAAMESQGGLSSSLIDSANSFVRWGTTSDDALAQATRGFIGLTPVVGPAMTAVGAFLKNASLIGGAVTSHPLITFLLVLSAAMVWAYYNVEWFRKAVDKTFKFMKENSALMAATLPVALLAIVPAALFASRKIAGLKNAFFGLFKKLTKSSRALNDSKKASENAGKGAESLKKGLNGLMKLGGIALVIASLALLALAIAPLAKTGLEGAIAMLAFGAAVGIMSVSLGMMGNRLTTGLVGIVAFAAAVSVMALAMAPIASTGTQGAIAMAVFGIVVAGLAIVFALLGPALTAASIGMLAFGAMAVMVGVSALLIGVGILFAMVGITMLAGVLPIIAVFGMQAAVAIFAFGAALIIFAVGALLAGVAMLILSAGLIVLSVGLFIAGAAAIVAGVGFMILGTGLTMVGQGLVAIAMGILFLYTTIQAIFSDIIDTVANAMNNAKDAVSNGIQNMISSVQNVGESLVDAGKNFVMGFVKGITGAVGSAIDAAKNMAKGAVNAVKGFLNIHSPSRLMKNEVGRYFAEGMAVGIDKNASGVADSSANMAASAVDAASEFALPDIQAPSVGLENVSNPGDMLANGFNNAINSLQSLLGLMGKTDGTTIGVNGQATDGQSSGFNPQSLVGGGNGQSTTNSDNSKTINVASGAIQIVTNGSDVDGETIARKLEDYLRTSADGSLKNA